MNAEPVSCTDVEDRRAQPGRLLSVTDPGRAKARRYNSSTGDTGQAVPGPARGSGVRCMRAEERQHRILALARHHGQVEVTAMAADLAVAPETIRRDLGVLERRGLVRRTYGGAYPVEGAGFETDLAQRVTLHVADKRRIAAEAVKLLGEAETVFVDEGYTPQLLAALLPGDRPLTVVTASLSTAAAVADSADTTVLLLGGRVRARTLATVGSLGLRHAGRLRHRPGLRRVQRHLPRTGPDHPRSGRRRRQGQGAGGLAPTGVHGRTTASSARAASAASPRSPTSRRSSPTPACPAPRRTATHCWARASSESDPRARPAQHTVQIPVAQPIHPTPSVRHRHAAGPSRTPEISPRTPNPPSDPVMKGTYHDALHPHQRKTAPHPSPAGPGRVRHAARRLLRERAEPAAAQARTPSTC